MHLDVMVPGEDKYALHVLMVTHGRKCAECKAGGRRKEGGNGEGCPLRRAFEGGDGEGKGD